MDFLIYNMIGKMTINTRSLFENHRIRQNRTFSDSSHAVDYGKLGSVAAKPFVEER